MNFAAPHEPMPSATWDQLVLLMPPVVTRFWRNGASSGLE